MVNDNRFGDNLKRIRSENNLTQGELADRLGMEQASISRYENGHHVPSIGSVSKIAFCLEVTISDLLDSKE